MENREILISLPENYLGEIMMQVVVADLIEGTGIEGCPPFYAASIEAYDMEAAAAKVGL